MALVSVERRGGTAVITYANPPLGTMTAPGSAEMLAAVAAIEDAAHVQMSRTHTEQWRNWLTEEIGKLGLKVTPSVANFVLIHFPTDQGKTAAEADAYLTRRGLVLRALNNYKLPHALRMTIGTEEANRLVVEGLRDFLAGK